MKIYFPCLSLRKGEHWRYYTGEACYQKIPTNWTVFQVHFILRCVNTSLRHFPKVGRGGGGGAVTCDEIVPRGSCSFLSCLMLWKLNGRPKERVGNGEFKDLLILKNFMAFLGYSVRKNSVFSESKCAPLPTIKYLWICPWNLGDDIVPIIQFAFSVVRETSLIMTNYRITWIKIVSNMHCFPPALLLSSVWTPR